MNARALVHLPPDRVELRPFVCPEPGPGQVLVEAAYTCVSPGTELRCLRTLSPGVAYVPGYSLAGRVIRCGPGVATPPGTAVLASGTRDAGGLPTRWGGHVSHAIVDAARLCPVPAGVNLADAAAARMAAIAFHGLRLSRPLAGERVAVIGLGLIGQFAARLHQIAGASVVAADRSQRRVDIAAAAGVRAVRILGSLKDDLKEELADGADVIVDATGVPAVMPEAIALGREVPWNDTPYDGVRYLVQGSYESGFVVPYEEAFFKEMSFLLPRSFQTRDLTAVLDLLDGGKLVVSDLVTLLPPGQAADAYAELARPDGRLLTVAFDWQADG